MLGSIYALGAIGVTLTFAILRFANFAHGETMTLGAYLTLTLVLVTGWHALAFLPVAMALAALIVLGMDRLFFRPLRHAPTIILVIASFGLMLMVRSLVQVVWGVELQGFSKGIALPWVLFDSLRIFPKHVIIVRRRARADARRARAPSLHAHRKGDACDVRFAGPRPPDRHRHRAGRARDLDRGSGPRRRGRGLPRPTTPTWRP